MQFRLKSVTTFRWSNRGTSNIVSSGTVNRFDTLRVFKYLEVHNRICKYSKLFVHKIIMNSRLWFWNWLVFISSKNIAPHAPAAPVAVRLGRRKSPRHAQIGPSDVVCPIRFEHVRLSQSDLAGISLHVKRRLGRLMWSAQSSLNMCPSRSPTWQAQASASGADWGVWYGLPNQV